MNYNYFVRCRKTNWDGLNVTFNTEVEMPGPITCLEDIEKIRNLIQGDVGFHFNIEILSWQRFEEKREEMDITE